MPFERLSSGGLYYLKLVVERFVLKSLAISAGLLVLFATSASADNWGHWRGDAGNGVSLTAQPPTEWSGTENVAWKVDIPGQGSGSPVVWEDRVYVVTAVNVGNPGGGKLSFQTLCFNRANGGLIWKKTAVESTPHQGTHSTNGYASASPCTDGKHVYSHFGSRGLYCYTMDGDLVWKRDDFGQMNTRNSFGEGSSPTLVDDMIIVPWDHEGPSALYALNKETGATVWKTDRDEPTNWSTPLIAQVGETKQVVLNGQNFARAYDLKTGKELWRCGGQTERPAASAVADGDLIFVGSGFRGAFLGAFKPSGNGDIEGTESVQWTTDRDTPDVASPLLSGGRLYFYKGKSGLLTCVDAKTGKPFYTAERIPGVSSTYASPVAAGGFVYLTDRNGTITVIKDAETMSVVATNPLGEPVDATPALVDNQLFIRSANSLYCIMK
jgi:outer membrane protein assembly factor BamB